MTPAHLTRTKAQEQWSTTEREWRKLDYILRPEKNQDLDPASMLGLANLPPCVRLRQVVGGCACVCVRAALL
jgi:hypothetical protein